MSILDFLTAAGYPIPNTVFKTPDWAIWLQDAAGVLLNEDEVSQTIITICTTVPGSDPLRPEFGCNFLPVLDYPLNQSGPILRARITAALATWEKRIKVIRVDVTPDIYGLLTIEITWQYAANSSGAARILSFNFAQ